jgi:hypothetical protein
MMESIINEFILPSKCPTSIQIFLIGISRAGQIIAEIKKRIPGSKRKKVTDLPFKRGNNPIAIKTDPTMKPNFLSSFIFVSVELKFLLPCLIF